MRSDHRRRRSRQHFSVLSETLTQLLGDRRDDLWNPHMHDAKANIFRSGRNPVPQEPHEFALGPTLPPRLPYGCHPSLLVESLASEPVLGMATAFEVLLTGCTLLIS